MKYIEKKRQDALMMDDLREASRTMYGMYLLEEAVRNQPSTQPNRKRGKWIVYYECPKCGEITKDFMEYCPFCNADMRGEEDG